MKTDSTSPTQAPSSLWQALTERNLSVNQAAKASGIRYDTIWKHCMGLRGISPAMALEYEAKLGIPKSELRPDLWPPRFAQQAAFAPEVTAPQEKTPDSMPEGRPQ